MGQNSKFLDEVILEPTPLTVDKHTEEVPNLSQDSDLEVKAEPQPVAQAHSKVTPRGRPRKDLSISTPDLYDWLVLELK